MIFLLFPDSRHIFIYGFVINIVIVLTDFENDTAGVCYQTVIYVNVVKFFPSKIEIYVRVIKTEKLKII